MQTKVAVLGAGFSGLATAWHLLNHPKAKKLNVTVIDPLGVGGGASGVAAGLLHPYAGLFARINFRAREGYTATRELLEISERTLGEKVCEDSGVLRVVLSEQQLKDYSICAKLHDDVDWLSAEETSIKVPGLASAPGIFIRSGITVYTEKYLLGLWKACAKLGARFEAKAIVSMEDLAEYDVVIAAVGASCKSIPELSYLPINGVKGQILELEWPEHIEPLSCVINSQVYCVMNQNNKTCFAGSTFEKNFPTTEPCLAEAEAEIMPKLIQLYPPLENAKIISCRAGVRARGPGHLPLAKHVGGKLWVITGMGSKGLLYHSLYAKELVDKILD